jgi:hypothetical protein
MLLRPHVRTAAPIRFPGTLEVDDSPLDVTGLVEVHRELGRDLGRSLAIRGFQVHPDQTMKYRAPSS